MSEELDDDDPKTGPGQLPVELPDDEDLLMRMVAHGQFPGGLRAQELLALGESDRQELARRKQQEGRTQDGRLSL